MARTKHYLDRDVLTMARQRIRHVFDVFDSVAVCFSGGKDSLATLHLVREIALERGIEKVNVIFRDEELIPDSVIRFVDSYRRMDWVDMVWYAVPLESQKYILGRTLEYVQWDPRRNWLRDKPPWAETLNGTERVHDQYSMDTVQAAPFPGRVALVNGIRASESLMRFRACVNKLNENYINASSTPKAAMVKPIYDWEENDVLKYFHDNKIPYCGIYDAQHAAGAQLRVATPLHAESAKRIGQLRAIDPAFYQGVMDLFPEMLVQERYYGDLNRDALVAEYAQSFDTIERWITENLEGGQLTKALKRLRGIRVRAAKRPTSYPLKEVLKYFMGGSYKREMIPVKGNT